MDQITFTIPLPTASTSVIEVEILTMIEVELVTEPTSE